MARGDVNLNLYMHGHDGITAAVARADQSVQKLGKNAERAARDASQAVGTIQGTIEGMTKAWDDMLMPWNQGLELVEKVGRTVGWAYGQLRQGQDIGNAGRIFAAQFDDAARAIGDFRDATRGSVDNVTLERIATSMGMVGLSAQETAEILRGSFALSAASGKELEEVVSAVLGALRGEMDSLQEKGVAVDLEAAYGGLAASIGKTVKELSDTEKAGARAQAVLEALGQAAGRVPVEELSFGLSRLEAQWSNVTAAIKEGIATAVLPLVDAMADATDAVGDTVGRLEEAARGTVDPMVRIGEAVYQMREAGVSDLEIAGAISRLGRASMLTTEQIVQMQMGLKRADEVADAFAGTMESLGARSLAAARKELDDVTVSLGTFFERQAEYFGSLGSKVAQSLADAYKPKGGGRREERLDFGFAQAIAQEVRGVDDHLGELAQALSARFGELDEMMQRTVSLSLLGDRIALEGRLAGLEESDRLAAIEAEHEFNRLAILRTVHDEEQAEIELHLEDMRYAAERRTALAEEELERFRQLSEDAQSLTGVASFLASFEDNGVATGLGLVSGLLGQIGSDFQNLAKFAPGSIAALGQVGAAFIKDKRAQAAVAGAFEMAAAVASAASLDFWGAGMHALAGGMYFAMAGGAGGGGGAAAAQGSGGRGVGARVSGGSASGGSGTGADRPFIINYGVIGMGGQEAGRSLVSIMGGVAGAGFAAGIEERRI